MEGVEQRLTAILVLLALCAGCAAPPEPPPADEPLTPARPPPAPAGDTGVRITMNVVQQAGGQLRATSAEGEIVLTLDPAAQAALVARPGDTISLECTVDEAGRLVAHKVSPHRGLNLYYGRVASLSGESVVLDSPLGERTFVVNRWSDLPNQLKVDDYVAVKHYAFDQGQAVLNIRRFPGRVQEDGQITGIAPDGTLTTRTLGGTRRYPRVTGIPADLAPGMLVRVTYRRGAADPFEGLAVERMPGPFEFIGKMSTYNPDTHLFAMVDAWSDVLGIVNLTLPEPPPESIVPGDLVHLTYGWADGRFPVVQAMEERPLSHVYFGRVESITEEEVTLTTLQGQAKRLTRTPATWLPIPVVRGDMADAIWTGDPTAPVVEVVVKE